MPSCLYIELSSMILSSLMYMFANLAKKPVYRTISYCTFTYFYPELENKMFSVVSMYILFTAQVEALANAPRLICYALRLLYCNSAREPVLPLGLRSWKNASPVQK